MDLNNIKFKNDFQLYKEIDITGLRYPKILDYNNTMLLFGSKIYKAENNVSKYLINKMILDSDFNVISESNVIDLSNIIKSYYENIYLSSWVRNIYVKDNIYFLNIEIKINNNNMNFTHTNYLIKTDDIKVFTIEKKYDINDFIFIENNNNLFCSKITSLSENFWGKYLFNFNINNLTIVPQFDKIVNYNDDYGHLIHNIYYDTVTNKYILFFSIRHKLNDYTNYSNNMNFIYKIYVAYTEDFINYHDTQEIKKDNINSYFVSYPHMFEYNDINYIVCNQDDFGKQKKLLLFRYH